MHLNLKILRSSSFNKWNGGFCTKKKKEMEVFLREEMEDFIIAVFGA